MKRQTMVSAAMLLASVVGFGGRAGAADYWAGSFSNAVVHVAEGDSETLGTVNLLDSATLEKTGAGELVVPLANIVQQKDFRLKVSAGRVKVTAGTEPSLPTPTEILNRATLWLDADDTESLVTATDGNGEEYVARWLDTRETKTSAPFDYLRARGEFVSTEGNTETKYPVKTTADGLPVVDLQGFGSGAVFCFESTANETAGSTSLNAYEVFAVYCQTRDKYGFLFGGTSWGYNNIAFHPSLSSITPGSGTLLRMETASQLDARWWWNGQEIDAMKYGCSRSSRVFGTHFTGIAGNLNGIGNYQLSTGQYANRNGGDGYAEVLIFTNRLTLAEHARVERYLCTKYGKSITATKSYTFDLAPGAEIAFDGVDVNAVTVTGSGKVIVPEAADFTVGYGTDMELNALSSGTTTLKCDAALPVARGQTLAAAEGLRGVDVTATDAAACAAEDVVKTGLQKATLRALPADTRRLEVRQGILALSSSFAETNREVYATITNWNFNGLLTGNNYSAAFKWGERYGWQVYYWPLQGSSGTFTDSYMEFVRQRDWSVAQSVNYQWYDYRGWGYENMVDNGYVGLRGASAISTMVTIPEDGAYELSFDWSRTTFFSRLRVLMGADTNQLSDVGYLVEIDGDTTDETYNRNGYLTWNRRRIRVGWLSKGSVALMFRNDVDGESKFRAYSLLDNVVMRKLPTDDTVCDLRGGDFEGLTTNSTFATGLVASERKFGPAYTLDDWECVQPAGGYWAIGPATRGMWSTNANKSVMQYFGYYSYLLERCDRPGHAQLVMGNTGGYAQKRVTLPAGTWKLMADLVSFHKTNDMGSYSLRTRTDAAILSATVTVGSGTATSLGTLVAPGSRALFDQEWANSFTVPDGGAEVLIKLQTTSAGAGVVVDYLRLRRVSAADCGELVTDGDFTLGTGWTVDTSAKSSDATSTLNRVRASVNGSVKAACTNEYAECLPQYDGAESGKFALIGDCAAIYQDVTFPTAGLYRLTYYTRSRNNWKEATSVNLAYGRNRLLAYTAADGVTNAIDIALADTTNWVQHTAVFKVAAAGTRSFGFRGLNVPTATAAIDGADSGGWDKAAFFDGVSIVKLSSEEVCAPVSLPADLSVKVARGAKLQLGFDGTHDVGTVRLGGTAAFGPVNAQTYPDYVIGPGTLNATKLPGLSVMFR